MTMIIEREVPMAQSNQTVNRIERIEFFGSVIDPLTMNETLQRVEEIIRTRAITQHVVINVAKLVLMQKDDKLRAAVNACGLINADGQGVVWGANLLGRKIPERVAGIDLFKNIVELSSKKGLRLYFLGAQENVVSKVIRILKSQYPQLQVAGFRNGYFSKEEEGQVAEDIRDSCADVLFVAMGSPQKEFFLNKYCETMAVTFVMGVGGSFDVIAGVTGRAPLWMQKAGLEWFFRFLCEPGRMWKRYLITNTIFGGMVLKALIKKESHSCEKK